MEHRRLRKLKPEEKRAYDATGALPPLREEEEHARRYHALEEKNRDCPGCMKSSEVRELTAYRKGDRDTVVQIWAEREKREREKTAKDRPPYSSPTPFPG